MIGNRLFVDVETLPAIGMSPEKKREFIIARVPKNYRDPEKIDKWIEEKGEEAWRKTALDPLLCQVFCISVAINDEDPFTFLDGDAYDFAEFLRDLWRDDQVGIWVAHSAQFDLHVLRTKLLAEDDATARKIPHSKWPAREGDLVGWHCTQEMWTGPFWGGCPPLKDIADYLGLEHPGVRGSDVYPMWLEERHEEIVEYCESDVRLCRELYTLMTGWRS